MLANWQAASEAIVICCRAAEVDFGGMPPDWHGRADHGEIIDMLVSSLLAVLLLAQTTGKVVSITDGDTIIVRPEQGASVKVRLIHIDAPERGQAFGTRARQELGELVADQTVEVVGTSKDRYGRLLGDVRHGGRSINLELVKRGMAWAFVEYKPPAEYVAAEAEARAARRGLWADKSPIPPWEYRKSRRAGSGK